MVVGGENMMIPYEILKEKYKEYSNVDNKIGREVRDGKLYTIIKGLYETDPNTPGYLLAQAIYGPSYISFEYALAQYGMIPERVNAITCACFKKRKKKVYQTDFGVFIYKDIPARAYPWEVLLKVEGNYSYHIATPEKALCDILYTLTPIKNYRYLEIMLFYDLRIDEDEFDQLNIDTIEKLSEFYHSTNVKRLAGYMKKRRKNEPNNSTDVNTVQY